MSAGAIGMLAGLLIAGVDFALLRLLASRVELDETKRALKIAGLSQFVLFPVIGYFVAPYVIGE
jgi:hypothetical protein